ncbi:MAG: tRNA (adenosine(37)-N6)-dimethylallyltransferase MiaA [Acidobacteriota bacterium]|nr:tRNA (adenosine(37)-N6)-dimethylallyltransferase MiaA [Blastocatellia bacterium]MDW8412037.1 tRNA (adenosine(37)-N6)-dimethylallyltransferase MiaA [Acidobacteriota bacterium]
MRPIVAIVGPTASGKSVLGIELAVRLNAEIVSLDSVQVYRGLYVATAKVPLQQRCGIPHHLIDIIDPDQEYTAGDYARDARRVISQIEQSGKQVLLVGGTGFYLSALEGSLFEQPVKTDQQLRRRLKQIMERRGAAHLHKMLARLDPAAAARINVNDWARTTRALEVLFQTGRSITYWQGNHHPQAAELASRIEVFALSPPRSELYARINRRVDEMFAAGLVEEVQQLLAAGLSPNAKSLMAHGYRRVVEYLLGQRDYASCVEQTKADTRHYAKRQLSWWRSRARVNWIYAFGDDVRAVEEVLKLLLLTK